MGTILRLGNRRKSDEMHSFLFSCVLCCISAAALPETMGMIGQDAAGRHFAAVNSKSCEMCGVHEITGL